MGQNQDCDQVLWAQNGSDTGMKLAWFDPQNGMNHFYEIYEDTDDIRQFYTFHRAKPRTGLVATPLETCQIDPTR